MAELVDAQGSGPCFRYGSGGSTPPRAPHRTPCGVGRIRDPVRSQVSSCGVAPAASAQGTPRARPHTNSPDSVRGPGNARSGTGNASARHRTNSPDSVPQRDPRPRTDRAGVPGPRVARQPGRRVGAGRDRADRDVPRAGHRQAPGRRAARRRRGAHGHGRRRPGGRPRPAHPALVPLPGRLLLRAPLRRLAGAGRGGRRRGRDRDRLGG